MKLESSNALHRSRSEGSAVPLFNSLAVTLRDVALERDINLTPRSPSEVELEAFRNFVDEARSAFGTAAPADLFELMLSHFQSSLVIGATPLSSVQRSRVSEILEPRYAEAIALDESPRERFQYIDCCERMVDVSALAREHGVRLLLSARPFDPACGPQYGGKSRIFWARETVAARLVEALQCCNRLGLIPCIEDGFRPFAVQAGLFARRYRAIRSENPDWSADTVLAATLSKTAGAPYRAAHMAGAAIDVTFWVDPCSSDSAGIVKLFTSLQSAKASERFTGYLPLPLGNDYPTGGAFTYLDCPYVNVEERMTRVIFQSLFEAFGFAVYRGEDWHISLGDAQAALLQQSDVALKAPETITVRYTALERFDPLEGSVNALAPEVQRQFFPIPE